MQVAVIGAGIAGLAVAAELERSGHRQYTVYESEPCAGGLCRSVTRGAYTFDTISHVLHFSSPEARRLAMEALNGNLFVSRRDAVIYFRGRYVPYPFQTHLGFLPPADGMACLAGILAARLHRLLRASTPETFAQWIETEFGSGIAQRFMLPYNRRLWGVEPSAMSLDWMRFVPRAPLSPVLASFFSRTKQQGYNAEFQYPAKGGIQSLVDGMKARVAPVQLRTQITAIDPARKRLYFEGGGGSAYDVLVTTMPLNRLAEICQDTPEGVQAAARKLRSVPIASITYGLRRPAQRPHHWVYFPHDDFPFFRLFFNSNVDPQSAPAGASVLSAEFANVQASELDRLTEETARALQRLDLIAGTGDIAFTHGTYLPCGYPVHDLMRKPAVATLLQHFRALDIWSIGRFGGWRYSSIEDGLLEGAAVAAGILNPPARLATVEV